MKTLFTSLLMISTSLTIWGCSQDTQPQTPTIQSQPLVFPDQYADYLNRDVRDDIFYFVMPDRFYNGEPKNDNGSTQYPESHGGFIIDNKFAFHGGDMQGIEAKLDYLKNLGVSAIWMTPILRNQAIQADGYAHHGYWILDFTQIDPHFGSNQTLKGLIDAAHKKGIKIFFDIITNHTADVIKYEQCHNVDGSFKDQNTCPYKSTEQVSQGDGYSPFLVKGTEHVKTPSWLNDPQYYHNQGDSFWQGESALNGDFVGLDDLDTQHPQVISGMIEIYKNIISQFKPDGFRIDTVKHVDMSFWSQFSPAIMEHALSVGIPKFHIFGEVYSADPVKLSSYTTQGKMPAVLDFGFQKAAADVFYRHKSVNQIKRLFNNDDYYTDSDSQADLLMNFLGNHDMGRAGFFIQQSNPDASDTDNLKRSILSHAFMYLSRGIPVVYYGDEQGFTGDGGDVGAREDMFPSQVAEYQDNNLLGTQTTPADDNFDQSHPLYLALRQLAQLRMDNKALRRGITYNRFFDERRQVFAISRVDPQQRIEYFTAFNASNKPQTITVDAASSEYINLGKTAQYTVARDKLEVTIPPLDFVLLKGNTALEVTTDLAAQFAGVEQLENRVRLDYNLAAQNQLLPGLVVTTELTDQNGQYSIVARDNTPPYSAIVLQQTYAKADKNRIRVTIENFAGQKQQYIFSDNRQNILIKQQ